MVNHNSPEKVAIDPIDGALLERVVSILEQARANVLRYFRTFYTVYCDREPEIRQIGSGELAESRKRHTQSGVLADLALAVESSDSVAGFSSSLGWSHYQVLMGVKDQRG